MKVSSDILREIIGRPSANFGRDGTRRFAYRVAVSKRATLCRAESTVRVPITVIDICVGGVGFIYAAELAPGEAFTLRLIGRNEHKLEVQCVVRWCKKTSSGRFRVGAEFMKLAKGEDKLQPLEAGRA